MSPPNDGQYALKPHQSHRRDGLGRKSSRSQARSTAVQMAESRRSTPRVDWSLGVAHALTGNAADAMLRPDDVKIDDALIRSQQELADTFSEEKTLPGKVDFAKFVEAVGRRFSGRYRDENDGRQRIPRVSIWSLVNEPNQAGWLAPQWEKGQMTSAIMARELFLRGRAALKRTGHGRDTIFFGETAPLGDDTYGDDLPDEPWLATRNAAPPHRQTGT